MSLYKKADEYMNFLMEVEKFDFYALKLVWHEISVLVFNI